MFDAQKSPHLIPSLIVLLAAIIVAGALIVTHQNNAHVGDTKMPANFVPAATTSPAHLMPQTGQPNPADSLQHYASYSPHSFVIASVGSNSITGAYVGSKTPVTLSVSSNTQIYSRGADKDPATYEQEMADFKTKLQYADTNDIYVAPDPFVHTPQNLSDLKSGTVVVVSSADGKTADTIFILPTQPQQPSK